MVEGSAARYAVQRTGARLAADAQTAATQRLIAAARIVSGILRATLLTDGSELLAPAPLHWLVVRAGALEYGHPAAVTIAASAAG